MVERFTQQEVDYLTEEEEAVFNLLIKLGDIELDKLDDSYKWSMYKTRDGGVWICRRNAYSKALGGKPLYRFHSNYWVLWDLDL